MTHLLKLTSVLALAAIAALAGSASPQAKGAAAACTERSYPGQPPKHTDNLKLRPQYNSFPPTTGTHYQYPARFDLYTFELPQLAVVHNLEHGGVAIQYGRKVPRATVARIKAWYLRDTNGLIVAPLAALGSKIALTAWNAPPYKSSTPDPGRGYVATCSRFDANEFSAFVKQRRYKAGERFPKSVLARQQQ
jgi:uncharacterized protein DUF3105